MAILATLTKAKEQFKFSDINTPEPSSPLIGVIWQWDHRDGFKNYDDRAAKRIERVYQSGLSHVRLKSGKNGRSPMELFLDDMVQWNPETDKVRAIKRIGPEDKWWEKILRTCRGYLKSWETGKPRRVKFNKYSGRLLRRTNSGTVLRDTTPTSVHSVMLSRSRGFITLRFWVGYCDKIYNSNWFSALTIFFIVASTIHIGIDADHNPDRGITVGKFTWFVLAENIFCLFFFLELSVRFGTFRKKKHCLCNPAFLFDGILTAVMICESWVLPLMLLASNDSSGPDTRGYAILRTFRLLKLSRLGRVVRILRMFPEVLTLLKGVAQASRSVVTTIMMQTILLYIFGTLFKIQAETTVLEETFISVPRSMWVLLIHGTFLDECSEILNVVLDASPYLAVLFLVFIFLSAVTLMNMLTGILCDVCFRVSATEKQRAEINHLKGKLLELMECFDTNEDGALDWHQFYLFVHNPELNQVLKEFGVDCSDLASLQDVLFESKEVSTSEKGDAVQRSKTIQKSSLPFDEFFEVVVRLRGGNSASVRDVVQLREKIDLKFQRLELQLHQSKVELQNDGLLPCSGSEQPVLRNKSIPAPFQRKLKDPAQQPEWTPQEQSEQKHNDLLEKVCSIQEAQQRQEVRHTELLEKISRVQQAQEVRSTLLLEKICSLQEAQQDMQKTQNLLLQNVYPDGFLKSMPGRPCKEHGKLDPVDTEAV